MRYHTYTLKLLKKKMLPREKRAQHINKRKLNMYKKLKVDPVYCWTQ